MRVFRPGRPTFVVAGNDRLMVRVVGEIASRGQPMVAIVSPDEPRIARSVGGYGVRVVVGGVSDPDVLRQAGVETAEAFAIVGLGDDANVHAAFAAVKLNPDIRLVVRMYNLRLGKRIEALFDNCRVMSSSAIAAPLLVDAVIGTRAVQTILAGGHRFRIGSPDRRDVLIPLVAEAPDEPPELLSSTVDERTTVAVSASSDGSADGLYEAAGQQVVVPRPPRRQRPMSRRLRAAALAVLRAFDLRVRVALISYVVLVFGASILFALALHLNYAQALYFTVTSVTSIGYSDISLASAAGWVQVAAVIIMVLAVFVIALLTAAVVNALVVERLRGASAGAEVLTGHVVVCGFGTVGRRVVELLRRAGYDCAVIEQAPTPEMIETARAARLPLITGDVTDPSVLRSAGVSRASAVLAVTSDDVTNLEAGMGARSVAQVRIVLRLGDDDLAVRAVGRLDSATVLSVFYVAGPVFAAALMGHLIVTTVQVGRRVLLIAEVRLGTGCDLAGQPVSAIDQPGQCRVFGLRGTPAGQLPDPGRLLRDGDVVVIAATRAGLSDIVVAAAAR